MYRREITERERERESASSRGKQKERTSARQKREPRCFRAFIPRRRERERKEIYRTITRGGLFLPRKKQKFNRRCLGGGGGKKTQHAPSYRCPARPPR